MSTPLLEADALRLRVGGAHGRILLDGLSLRIEPGQLWCVLGPNGSGKTTLLHALAGLHAPDRGSVRLAGRPLRDWPLHEAARRRGLLPQALHDAFSASALDVVLLGRHPHLARWSWEGDAERDIALAALRAVEMDAAAARDVTSLSGGERQRVAIAALLAQDPQLMLLDEPLAHLDLRHQVGTLQHLAALARAGGKAVLLSLHDLNLAHRFATHALVLGGERPVQGDADAVLDEGALSAAFGHPVARHRAGGRTLFVAG